MTCRTAARPSASRRFQSCPLRLRGPLLVLVALSILNRGNPGRPAPAPTTLYLKRRPRRRRVSGLTRRRRARPARAPRLPRPGPPSLELRWCARARRPVRRLRRRMRKPRRRRGDGGTLAPSRRCATAAMASEATGKRKTTPHNKPSKSAGAQSFLGAFLDTTAATLSTAPPNNTRPSAV